MDIYTQWVCCYRLRFRWFIISLPSVGSIFMDEKEWTDSSEWASKGPSNSKKEFVFFLAIVQFFFSSTLHSSHFFHLNYSFLFPLGIWWRYLAISSFILVVPFTFTQSSELSRKVSFFPCTIFFLFAQNKKEFIHFLWSFFYAPFFRGFHGRL